MLETEKRENVENEPAPAKAESVSSTKTESEIHQSDSCCAGHDHHDDSEDWRQNDVKKKVPGWAIALAIVAFLIFNAFFLAFAMQATSTSPG